ncbi:MAG: gamma-glutamyl-gamma-aminobutyrate hydrolase family protein [Lachnospiraceae bacterium]|nr:gamma-glutamyl-gamma-aminobutyrate hydrolase family protein [Lachnospiraceae bacterium]
MSESGYRPLILLSPNITEDAPNERMYNNDSYFRAVRSAGAIPLTCGNVIDLDEPLAEPYMNDYADELAARADGMIITGGWDVDPHLYTENINERSRYDARMDVLDTILMDAFYRARKPVFGICRGIQFINVHFGGTLIQDIEEEKGIPNSVHNMRARDPVPDNFFHAHEVSFKEGSELQRIFADGGSPAIAGVNSYHHQALQRVAEGFTVTAVSTDDGIIEGIESTERLDPSDPLSPPLIYAVQWHPERMIREKGQFGLFKRFTEICSIGR